MTPTPTNLYEELVAADAQGERALMTLWPGDQFYFRKKWHTIHSMQWHSDRQRIIVKCEEPTGPARTMKGLHGKEISYQPRRTFLLFGIDTFLSMLSDEHFVSENPAQQEVW